MGRLCIVWGRHLGTSGVGKVQVKVLEAGVDLKKAKRFEGVEIYRKW